MPAYAKATLQERSMPTLGTGQGLVSLYLLLELPQIDSRKACAEFAASKRHTMEAKNLMLTQLKREAMTRMSRRTNKVITDCQPEYSV